MPAAITRELFNLFVDEGFHHTQSYLGSGLLDGSCDVEKYFAHRQYHLEAGFAISQRYRNSIVVGMVHLSL